MSSKTINKVTLKFCQEKKTNLLGLPFLWESLKKLDLTRDFYGANRKPKRKQIYKNSDSIKSVVFSQMIGGSCLQDMRLLHNLS